MAILRNDETALEHDAMQQSRGLERWLENKHALDIFRLRTMKVVIKEQT